MHNDSQPVEELANSSVRQNRILLILTIFIVLCLIILFKLSEILIDEEKIKINNNFTKTINLINLNERFLLDINNQYRLYPSNFDLPGGTQFVMMNELQHIYGKKLYRGRGLNVSIPFTISSDENSLKYKFDNSIKMTVRMAAYYANFWSSSEFEGPQLILISHDPKFSISIPATDYIKIKTPLRQDNYIDSIEDLRNNILKEHISINDSRVWWSTLGSKDTLYGFILINMKSINLKNPMKQFLILSTSFKIKDYSKAISNQEKLFYDTFTLISPEGNTVIGPKINLNNFSDGLNIKKNGLYLVLKKNSHNNWTGIYSISYINFIKLLQIPLFSILFIFSISIFLMLLINNWYTKTIVQPAEKSYFDLLEAKKFIADVIDNAPNGISIVRCSDQKILLENKNSRTWNCTNEILDLIKKQPDSTEFCLKFNGIYLQVFFILTRYYGEQIILCAFNDITQHRNDNVELAKAKILADQASDAKTLFLATMSHEVRTPLYGVLGNLELLNLTDLSSDQKLYLDSIKNSSYYLSKIISDILDISKIELNQFDIQYSIFSPSLMAKDIINSLQATAEMKKIKITLTFDPRIPQYIQSDHMRIKQILLNLLNNAIKFTEVGYVNLHISLLDQNEDISTILWQISDTGIGISKEQQELLFNIFYQVNDSYIKDGAGLGLAICSKLSHLLGGKLKVLSDLGTGSSFFLELPVKTINSEIQSLEEANQFPLFFSNEKKYKVLIAEDNYINRSILEKQLENLGLNVVSESNGMNALKAWNEEKFDLIIIDINMPKLNGYELTKKIRTLDSVTPIIGVTANATIEEKERCIKAGMNSFIVKPLSIEDLKNAIGNILIPVTTTSFNGLSIEMKQLFTKSTKEDLNIALDAINSKNYIILIQLLHKISGSYAAIEEIQIAKTCFKYENIIKNRFFDSTDIQNLKSFLNFLYQNLES
ncbi:response regulator [Acinetobacter sp. V89_7]|uniref:response regulator n=1 Tax=Acinetobacter sp. V89_7 TaxID=3044233 RepID=UPI00249E84F4|nr:response regulator [Acinetobacter sp. V89_7]MDI3379612.1 response regulator [Acinetobacter sp. V89_7]